MTSDLQPDQRYALWNDHVPVYEAVFEPLTDQFARAAITALDLAPGTLCLDVAAGSGGAALMAARAGARVVAIDAAPGMVRRVRERAAEARLPVSAAVMDAQGLALPDAAFAAALSVFGLILCPDAGRALTEAARALRPGGRIAVVTWTEPQNYELVARLLAAAAAVRGPLPPPPAAPAQLRYSDPAAFRALLASAGLAVEPIRRLEANLEAPSARWLAERLGFAPGLAALLAAQGEAREAVIARFCADLERDQGAGPVDLRAVAQLGLARRSETGPVAAS